MSEIDDACKKFSLLVGAKMLVVIAFQGDRTTAYTVGDTRHNAAIAKLAGGAAVEGARNFLNVIGAKN